MRPILVLALPVAMTFAALCANAQSAGTAEPSEAKVAVETVTPLEAEVAIETAPMTAVERWQADPMTIFSGAEVDLEAFQWIARPVIVFANTPADPAFQDQMALFAARPAVLAERDVVLIADSDPAGRSDVRLKLRPRGFMLAILGKDGRVLLRKPLPWDVRELTRTIDKSPERQRELEERALRK